jgi:hypothetical protein
VSSIASFVAAAALALAQPHSSLAGTSWDFEPVAVPLPGCLAQGVSCPGLLGWDVPQWPELRNGQTSVVRPGEYGVPARAGGSNGHVLRASVSLRQRARGQYAAYLYKIWATGPPESRWNSAISDIPIERIRRGQEAGTYRAWYFIPKSTRRILQHNETGGFGWVNIFQFKHSNPNGKGRGRWAQPPQWWVNVRNSSAKHLTLCVSNWKRASFCERRGLRGRRLPPVPFGRWFELRADVQPGKRIDFYLNGKRFDTGLQRDYPVGLRRGDSSWVFSPGWYLNTGTAFIDDASFVPFAPVG